MNHNSQDELIAKLLPEGVEDPGKGSLPDSGRSLEEIRKAAMKSTLANSKVEKKEKKKEPEYKRIPIYVLEALKASHPGHLNRATTIEKYISEDLRVRSLAIKGKSRLNTVFVRNWSYDEDSESVIISDSFTSPAKAGSNETGTTGIDVDKSLGF